MLKSISVILLIAFVGGCQAHHSPRQRDAGDQFLFVTDDERGIFRETYNELSKAKPEYPATDLTGPVRGYALHWRILFDSYTTYVRVFRARGVGVDGKFYYGYYPEVSGDGTAIASGPAFNSKFYPKLVERLSKFSPKITVSNLERIEYRETADRWRLNSSPSLRDGDALHVKQGAAPKDIKKRLTELEQLRREKAITKQEYQRLRKKILDGI